MKHFGQRLLSLLLVLCVVTALFAGLTTVSAKNTLTRGTVCNSLSTKAKAYYTGDYTYSNMSTLQGGTPDKTTGKVSSLATTNTAMYKQLQKLMSSTMTSYVNYKGNNGLQEYWPTTDNSILFYSNATYNPNNTSSFNREHVWPKSRASFYQKNGGSDLHHLRPTNPNVNSTRGNHTMGNVKGVLSSYKTYQFNGKDVLWYNASGNGLVEVNDYVKGDVARILLYVYVRWGQPNLFETVSSSNLPPFDSDDNKNNGVKVIESLDTLLEWCEIDPVDTWEMTRNDEVQTIQGNRNVFIDYPEYAWLLFGQDIPTDMATPSGEAKNATPACAHTNVEQQSKAATCTEAGYERTVCKDCGKQLTNTVKPALGHNFVTGTCTRCGAADPDYKPDCQHTNVEPQTKAATCTEAGYERTVCKDCGKVLTDTAKPALGHSYAEGKCTRCGAADPNYKTDCKHEHTKEESREATCTIGGYERTVCLDCGAELMGTSEPALGHSYLNGTCTRCGAADPNAKPANTPKYTDFSDLPVFSWYKDGVSYALENGLMNGVAKREFDPDGNVTRAMFVTILYRAETSPSVEGKTNPFTDVPAGQWYTDAVVWASNSGIVTGTSATAYSPDAPITREQIATILYRYSKAEKVEQSLESYPDAGTVSGYALDAVRWAVKNEILNGKDGSLAPKENATRAQIATILMRYLEK